MKNLFPTVFMMLVMSLSCATPSEAQAQSYQKADNPLFTPWAEEVGPDNALPEYPRPMMKRDHWQ
ncbi:MAG: hypothetical protein KGY70_15540, partial [Bacteroidales bacterium]|nr:hypothetical protein [Bacteroidales bacterium]